MSTTSRPTMILTGKRRRKVEAGYTLPSATLAAIRSAHEENLKDQGSGVPEKFLITNEDLGINNVPDLPISQHIKAA